MIGRVPPACPAASVWRWTVWLFLVACTAMVSCGQASLSQRSPDGKRSILVKNISRGRGIEIAFREDLSQKEIYWRRSTERIVIHSVETLWLEQPRVVVVYTCNSVAEPTFIAYQIERDELIDGGPFKERMIQRLIERHRLDPNLVEMSRARGMDPLRTPCEQSAEGSKIAN